MARLAGAASPPPPPGRASVSLAVVAAVLGVLVGALLAGGVLLGGGGTLALARPSASCLVLPAVAGGDPAAGAVSSRAAAAGAEEAAGETGAAAEPGGAADAGAEPVAAADAQPAAAADAQPAAVAGAASRRPGEAEPLCGGSVPSVQESLRMVDPVGENLLPDAARYAEGFTRADVITTANNLGADTDTYMLVREGRGGGTEAAPGGRWLRRRVVVCGGVFGRLLCTAHWSLVVGRRWRSRTMRSSSHAGRPTLNVRAALWAEELLRTPVTDAAPACALPPPHTHTRTHTLPPPPLALHAQATLLATW